MRDRCSTDFDTAKDSAYQGDQCKAPGCPNGNGRGRNNLGRGGHGRGYCPKHYQQVLRTGSPLPKRVLLDAALLEAALAFADRVTSLRAAAVCGAALRVHPPLARGGIPPRTPSARELLDASGADALADAALAYANVPAEPGYDKEFSDTLAALRAAAKKYARAVRRDLFGRKV